MDALRQDLRQTVRTLRRQIGFSAVVILTLAVGIGANTAVFTLVHSTLLAQLPYRSPERLAMLFTSIPAQGVHDARSAYANIQDWRLQNRSFEDLATFDPTTLTLTGGEFPEQISTARTSANLASVLGVAPALGRFFSVEEERQRAPVVVLSHPFWLSRFDGSSDVLGRTVELAGIPFQVVGVMPSQFGFAERNTQLWLPQTLFTDWEAAAARRGIDAWFVIGRLARGSSIEGARTDMGAIAARLERTHPETNAGLGVAVVPLAEQETGHSYRVALWTLFAAVGIVLLIACANTAHLILARGMDRRQEFALRQALGAGTPRLIQQALTESVMLALAAGLAGVLLALGGVRLLIALAPANLPRLAEVGIDGPVLLYALAASLISGLLFGTAPALSASQPDLFDLLRAGSPPARRSRGHRAREALIVFQFALAIILVFGANLLIRSLIEAQRVEAGFTAENVLMANLSVETASRRIDFYERALREVQAIPAVASAGIIEDLFISGAPSRSIVTEGATAEQASFEPMRSDAIDGDVFGAIGVRVEEGRGFSASDGADAPPVAIVNETMARRFWPGESAVSKRFRFGGQDTGGPWIEIVGVVGDMRRQGPESEPIAQVFRPYSQEPSRNMNLLVRSDAPAAALTSSIRERIAAIDRTVPVYGITTAEQTLDRYLLQRRFQTLLLGLFSLIALILAAVGIYGLIQYSVTRRRHELSVRLALGASGGNLVSMVVRQGLALALPGLATGILCAVWLSDAASALLFGISTSDPMNIVLPAGILLAAALLACWVPARRAARIDPMTVLRGR